MKSTAHILSRSQGRPSGMVGHGESHPPRNMIEHRAETRIMFMYSARKNTANVTPEYSTWNPATISDSPSATSKGWRLVSAMPEMKYTRNMGASGSQFQERKLSPLCAK